jgi:hypothetical protein
MCSHTCGFPIVPEIDDYCMRAPAPPLRFSLLSAEVEVMFFAMRHGVPSIGVPCVPWCKGMGPVTGISIIVSAVSLSDFSSFFLSQRDLSSLELTH